MIPSVVGRQLEGRFERLLKTQFQVRETWGRGIGVMASECRRVGLPLPTTVQEGGYVVTTFRRPQSPGSGSNLDQGDPDPIQIEPDSDSVFRAKLLQTIRFNPLISRKVLADEMGVSERKVRKALDDLKKSGVILRQGPEHGGIWRISIRQNRQVADVPNATQKSATDSTLKSTLNGALKSTLNQTDAKIVELIQNDASVTIPVLEGQLGLSREGIRKALKRLKSANVIRRVGPDRGGHWEVVK